MVTRWFRSGASISELFDGREYELAIEGDERLEMISFPISRVVVANFFDDTSSCMGSPSTWTLTTSEDQLKSNGCEAPPPSDVVFPPIISNTFIFVRGTVVVVEPPDFDVCPACTTGCLCNRPINSTSSWLAAYQQTCPADQGVIILN